MSTRMLIYFIKPVGLDGPIKIGCSRCPKERLLTLAVWSPFPLELIGAAPGNFGDEKFLHQCFADVHSHREWFRSTPALRDAIKTVISAGSVNVLRGLLAPKGGIRTPHQRTYSPEQRLFASYNHRIRRANLRLRDQGEGAAWYKPNDVAAIMYRWENFSRVLRLGAGAACYPAQPPRQPTPDEFARLEEYLKNPAAHSIVPPWRCSVVPIRTGAAA